MTGAVGPALEAGFPKNDRIIFAYRSQDVVVRAEYDTFDSFLFCTESSQQFVGPHVPKTNVTVLTSGRQHLSITSEVHA